jgi:transposase
VAARKRQHAQILLKADASEGGPAWADECIAEAFDVSVRTVERIRQRLVEHGLEDALERRQNPNGPLKHRRLDGVGEAQLTKIACSKPPAGRERWTIKMLRDEIVLLEVVESICCETVRQTLKKTSSSLG